MEYVQTIRSRKEIKEKHTEPERERESKSKSEWAKQWELNEKHKQKDCARVWTRIQLLVCKYAFGIVCERWCVGKCLTHISHLRIVDLLFAEELY